MRHIETPNVDARFLRTKGRRLESQGRGWMSIAVTALLLGSISGSGLLGCSSKSAGDGAETDPTDVPTTMSVEGKNLIAPASQTRWAYNGNPTPAPASKPNYLLKSYTCAKGSASVDNEAKGALRDLAEILVKKPSVTILCLGLCDASDEKVNAENLGMTRAQNARKFLIDNGVEKGRISFATFASAQAKAPANEAIGQARDRRVEVWLLKE